MRDPYEVLEIKRGASKDEIKSAYKKLAKQYHPDQYGDNPLKDLAEEKMAEVNEAYQSLMKSTESGTGYSSSGNGYKYTENSSTGYRSSSSSNSKSSSQSGTNDTSYQAIRNDINLGNLSSAEKKLNSLPFKDAEWNYLMGLLYLKKGWYDSANSYITTAYNMSPSNVEYKNTYNKLTTQNKTYRQNYYGHTKNNSDDMCDLCTKLWCLDSMCECAGGDLIPCC